MTQTDRPGGTLDTRGSSADGHPARRRAAAGDTRLRLYRNPLRLLFSASTWLAAGYLTVYVLITGWVLFSVALTTTVTAACLAITLAGIPLLVAAAGVLRGCANVERARLRRMLAGPVQGSYRQPAAPGLMAQVRTRWHDRSTWRDVGYLIGLWLPLFILDTIVFTVWLTLLAGITLPIWYWAPFQHFPHGRTVHGVQLGYFPNGPSGPGHWGLYLDTLPKALLTGVVCLVLFLLFNYVLVLTARAHARIARSLLRAPADPLAEAKEVLTRPGPLGPLSRQTANGR
jgi:Putative sensor